jgi:DNA polymerase I
VAKTGRNAPSTNQFIFGAPSWLRGLIKPAEGMALAYVDYEQQEFGVAAALSGDPGMQQAYLSGDPYLGFAKQAGAVPPDGTKKGFRDLRDRFKQCAIGVQYGMATKSLAILLGVSAANAQQFLRMHKDTFPRYWGWSREVVRHANREKRLQAAFGWTLNVTADTSPLTIRNFPLQANGAEMLRLACCFLTESGVRVCAPVHDALLIEAPVEDIEKAVNTCQQAMGKASEAVLKGFPLRTEAKVIRYPDRYGDQRGLRMWEQVFGLLDGVESSGSPGNGVLQGRDSLLPAW